MSYTITQIEDAIIAALDVDPINTYAKTIGSYAGQFEQDIGQVLAILPAVLVVYTGGPFRNAQGRNTIYNRIGKWSVLVGCQNLRGDLATRRGVGSEVGIYEMLEDVRVKLVGKSVGLDIEPLRPIDEKAILVSKRAHIYGIDFESGYDYVNT